MENQAPLSAQANVTTPQRQPRSHALDSNRKDERWRLLAKRLGRRYSGCRLANYEANTKGQVSVMQQVKAYLECLTSRAKEGQSVIFYGPPGTGKDHLLCAMLYEAIKAGAFVKWQDGAEMFGGFRDAIKGTETEGKIMDRYTEPTFLAISDPVPPIGGLSEYQSSMFFRIIDRRYRDMKATWITINAADREEMEKRISPNIVDRLGHNALSLPCKWPSYRKA